MNKLINLNKLSDEAKKVLVEARPYLGDITNPKLQELYYQWCVATNGVVPKSDDIEKNLNQFFVASKQWVAKKAYESKKDNLKSNIRSELINYRDMVMKGGFNESL